MAARAVPQRRVAARDSAAASARRASPPLATFWSGLPLALFTALVVSRPLVPSEVSATRGGGQLYVLLWIGLAAIWLALIASGRQPPRVRFNRLDLAVLALFALQACLGLWHAPGAQTRPALNLVGEQLALAVGYFLARQLVVGPRTMRWLLGAMIALAVVQSALGLFQYTRTMPATRAVYRADPERALREAGIDAPPGSPQRALFEQRLNSSEPLARFELTNSLAGFLTIWLVVLLAVAAVATPHGDSAAATRVSAAVVAVIIGICLVLTKSRSAYVAAAAALAVIAFWQARRRGWLSWQRIALAAVAAAVLLGAAVLVGGLDREVLTEAPKSLGYRLQYWQGTLEMIRQAPLTGYGLANFGDRYTLYKSPTASEEIADPHNFLLETAANSGLVAAALMLTALGCFFWTAARSDRASFTPAVEVSPGWIIAGAVAAPLLAIVASHLADVPLGLVDLLIVYATGGAAFVLLIPWLRSTGDLAAPLTIAALALLIDLLAAGGIGFPSIAGSLWLVVAVAQNAAHSDGDDRPIGTRSAAVAALCMTLAMAGAFFAAYRPVVVSQAWLREAYLAPGSLDQQRARLRAAAEADDLASEPWAMLAGMELDAATAGQGSPRPLDTFHQAAGQWLQRASASSSAAWLHAGDLYMAAFNRAHADIDLRAAVDSYARAVALYPNNALRRAKYALALQAAGDPQAATEAAQAWRLDALTPHLDQKLPPDLRGALEQRGWRQN